MASCPITTSNESSATESTALRQIAVDATRFGGYKPLDPARREIRLLELNADFICHVRHVSLNDRPGYVALSYYWGPPGATRPIILDGEELHIRKTLHQLLKSLIHLFGPLTVWLDVLCINQRLAAEQSSQVALMGDIYVQAQAVYAWVGKGDPDTDYAMQYMKSSDRALWATNHQRMALAGIEQIFLRRYWTRVWIIQECSLNTRTYLICGKMEVDLDELIEAFNQLSKSFRNSIFRLPDSVPKGTFSQELDDRDDSSLSAPRLAALQIRTIAKARKATGVTSKTSLLDTTYTFRHCDCQDPKDMIYGFRAISEDGERLRVDYTSSVFDVIVRLITLQNQRSFVEWIEETSSGGRFGGLNANPSDSWYRSGPTEAGKNLYGDNFLGIISDCLMLCQRLRFPIHQVDRQSLAHDRDDWSVISLRKIKKPARVNKPQQRCFAMTASKHEPERPAIHVLVDPLMNKISDIYLPFQNEFHERLCGRVARIARGHIWLCQLGWAVHISRFFVLVLMELEQSNWQSLPDYLSQEVVQDAPLWNRDCLCRSQMDWS